MTTYTKYPLPTEIPMLDGSQMIPVDDLRATRFQNGSLRVSAMQPAFKRTWTLRHRVDDATLADYMTFYADYSRATWPFRWVDGVDYTGCCFLGPPTQSYANALIDIVAVVGQQ